MPTASARASANTWTPRRRHEPHSSSAPRRALGNTSKRQSLPRVMHSCTAPPKSARAIATREGPNVEASRERLKSAEWHGDNRLEHPGQRAPRQHLPWCPTQGPASGQEDRVRHRDDVAPGEQGGGDDDNVAHRPDRRCAEQDPQRLLDPIENLPVGRTGRS